MGKLKAHTGPTSIFTRAWHLIHPLVPDTLEIKARRYGQAIHSRHLSASDRLLLSYPKSGSTWLRTMIAHLQSRGSATAGDLASWVPPLHMVGSSPLATPRVVRSHDAINTPFFGKAGQILVLVRDPRALVVSYATHESRRGRKITVAQSVDQLLGNGFNGLGSWVEHCRSLMAVVDDKSINWFRYEDLRNNTCNELTKISNYLGIKASHNEIQEAVEFSMPENMKLDRRNAGVDADGKGGSDVREAHVEQWREECPLAQQERIVNAAGSLMEKFNYD